MRWPLIHFRNRIFSGDLQGGRGVRCGDHLPTHKYIRNTSTCGTTPTEHLLNAGRRPQTSQKPCGWQGLGASARCQACASEAGEPSSGHYPPETSQLHVISNSKSSPRDLHLNAKTQLHSTTSKLQCWTPYAKQLAREEHNLSISREAAKNLSKVTDTPKHTTRHGPAHQKDKIQPHPPEHRHHSPPPGSLHNPLNQP